MNINWIKRENSRQLILFFNGWGMDSSAIEHLKAENYDLVEVNDYSILDFNENDYKSYSEIYVIAWSLGVCVASVILSDTSLPIKRAVAINGTLNPVDSNEGIPPDIFKGTISGWNEKSKGRFQMRIIGGRNEYEVNCLKFGSRTIQNQKLELMSLYDRFQNKTERIFSFDTAIIGKRDAIFSMENQLNCWQSTTKYEIIDIPHYPFLHFKFWDEIIKK